MESSAEQIHNNIRRVEAYQRHMRVRESQGRKKAEQLNETVLVWSLTCTLSILLVSVGQVIILRRFFSGSAVQTKHWYRRPELEEVSLRIQRNTRLMMDYQRHNRVKEAQGRKKAEHLNHMVFLWSLVVTMSILLVSVAQVLILKKLFSGITVDGYGKESKLNAYLMSDYDD